MKSRYASSAFDGEGAWRYGGRWNSPGVRVAYASETVALALLEVMVHLQSAAVLPAYSVCSVSFDEALVEILPPEQLPKSWRRFPAPPEVQSLGDRWLASGRTLALRVPSAIVPAEFNYLINVAHPDASKLETLPPVPFEFDTRLHRPPSTQG